MDYTALRSVSDSLIKGFSNGQSAVLLKGKKSRDIETGKIRKSFRQVPGLAVMTGYTEEAIGQSGGVVEAGDVKLICRFSEKPVEAEDRIRYAGTDYNIIHARTVDPQGSSAVVYIVQGRKA